MNPALLTLSLLLLAIINGNPSLSKAETVVDSDGHPVVPGSKYHLSAPPYILGRGGLNLARIGNSDCPVDVLVKLYHKGQAVILEPLNNSAVDISTDTPLNVLFAETPSCAAKSPKWKLPLTTTNRSYVRIGVVPDQKRFQIKRYETSEHGPVYEFVHTFKVFGIQFTIDIGIKDDEHGNRRLAAISSTDDSPFLFVFNSVSDEAKIRMKTA